MKPSWSLIGTKYEVGKFVEEREREEDEIDSESDGADTGVLDSNEEVQVEPPKKKQKNSKKAALDTEVKV